MSDFRPLPARPNLEFERKTAKVLLRRLRAGDREAFARARASHPSLDLSEPSRIRLSDAQHLIAREYGFSSWPKLAQYFEAVERETPRGLHDRHFHEGFARSLLVEHRMRKVWAARTLAAYVPRFFGLSIDQVFSATVSEDEVRLAMARLHCAPSWDVLMELVDAQEREGPLDWAERPSIRASRAIAAGDLAELQRIVAEHPEILPAPGVRDGRGYSLFTEAAVLERNFGIERMRPIVEWFVSQGWNLQEELNRQLCGHMRMSAEHVRWLIKRGADPNWVAPNGISVLEHALVRMWNGEAVDAIAAHCTPRKALWIAAGLGDVAGVARFLDANGKPTAAARRHRPDFAAAGLFPMPALPDADDDEILLEAFLIAMQLGRTNVLEYMASRGAPINSLVFGTPLLLLAVGNLWLPVAECMVRCGADLDLRGWRPEATAREQARERFEQQPDSPGTRRMVEICGLDPDQVLAERDARPYAPPTIDRDLVDALRSAEDDAVRQGARVVQPEHLLFGLLRGGGPAAYFFTSVSGVNPLRFRAELRDRLEPSGAVAAHEPLSLDDESKALLAAATAFATSRRLSYIEGRHLLHALALQPYGVMKPWLERYGGRVETLLAALDRV